MTGPTSGLARLAEDTRRRFLTEIASRVPVERIVEVHLFAPIRQSGVETGVAIVAAHPIPTAPEPLGTDALACDPTDTADEALQEAALQDTALHEAALHEAALHETALHETALHETALPDTPSDVTPSDVTPSDVTPSDVTPSDVTPSDVTPSDVTAPVRHTIFTARYRLIIKGADRGKWDADVVEEADAPLVAVEAVVRGVQRRAGDTSDPDRLGVDMVARILAGDVTVP